MNKFIISSASTTLLSALLLTAGCSSGGDSGGGGGTAVPANAIVLDTTNAETTVASSVTTADTLNLILAIDATPTMGLLDAIEIIQPRIESIKNKLRNSGVDLVYGADISDSGNCIVSGTFSVNAHESGTAPSFTDSGTVTATNCDDGEGFIANGNFSWVQSWNNITGKYNDTLTGTISIVLTNLQGSPTFNFNGIDYAENGNDSDGTYTVTKATFAVDFNGGSGFLVNLTAPIIESVGGFDHCPESGTILITGGNGTTAEGIYNGDGSMTIKVNGKIVDTNATCYR